MFRPGSPVRLLVALAIIVGLAVSPTQTAPAATASVPDLAAAPVHYPTLAGPGGQAVASGDLNGDGLTDLLVGQAVGFKVGLGDGLGGMTFNGAFGSGAVPNAIEVADLNGDGHLDAVTSNHDNFNGTTFSVTFGTGTGAFGAEVTYNVGISTNVITRVATADVTGDGAVDVLVVSSRGCGANSRGCSSVTVFQNDGSGGLTSAFSRASNAPVGHYYSAYYDVATGDFNNDGLADLAVMVNTYDFGTEPQLEILPGQGGGAFGATQYVRLPTLGGRAPFHSAELQVADVTGDGAQDIVVMSMRVYSGNSALIVMRNDGTGAFPQANGTGHTLNWFLGVSPMVGDLNDDGHLDIAGAINNGGFVYYLNDGSGGFPTGESRYDVGAIGAAVLADVNNSGAGSLDPVFVRPNATFTLLNGTPIPPSCGAGTYSASGNEPCTSADPGYFVADEGATSQTACPVGTYSSVIGAEACQPAPAGSYVDTVAATGSLLCAAGSFSATIGSASCTLAAAGFFVPMIGATEQTACPSGYGSDVGATACVPLDNDGDGVNNDDDAYPDSNMNATVSVGVCTTTVANQVLPNGATFNDLLASAAAGAASHGALVHAVTQLANGWKSAGLISGRDHGMITSCVARSKSGKSGKSGKSDKSDKSDKSNKWDKSDKSDKSDKRDSKDNKGKFDKSGKSHNSSHGKKPAHKK